MIRVLLVDDNGPILKSLCSFLEAAEDIQVVATATNGVDAVDKACSYRPDMAVIDISMPILNGIEATVHILECWPLTQVILLSGFDNPAYVQRALEVGAKGYVLKDSAGHDLLKAIHTIQRGDRYFSEKIAEIAEKYLARKGDHNSAV